MNPSLDDLKTFVQNLADTAVPLHSVNQYWGPDPNARARRHNLQQYLSHMITLQPKVLLVGEAPGYRGCRLSGIPFVSRDILRHGVKNADFFGEVNGYQLPAEWPHMQKEASATMVWQAVGLFHPPPLLWNVYPFHPHQPGNGQSNRKPTRQELAMGESFLRQLHQLFDRPQLVAVGKTAVSAMAAWQLPHSHVRHPSHGGKAQFSAGVAAIMEKMCQPPSF